MFEDTIDLSQPIEFYRFIGTYKEYAYTTDLIDRELFGMTFRAVPGLKRSKLVIGTQEDSQDEISIEIPLTEEIVRDYAFDITPPELTLQLWRGDRLNISNVDLIWQGPIGTIRSSGNIAIFKCPSQFQAVLEGEVPNVRIQPQCNNALFDEGCKVLRSTHSVNATIVQVISNREIQVSTRGSRDVEYFKNGEFVIPASNERRTILSVTGTNIVKVAYDFAGARIGLACQITAGCNRAWDDDVYGCGKFNNKLNFRGHPYIPGESSNVFTIGLQ